MGLRMGQKETALAELLERADRAVAESKRLQEEHWELQHLAAQRDTSIQHGLQMADKARKKGRRGTMF